MMNIDSGGDDNDDGDDDCHMIIFAVSLLLLSRKQAPLSLAEVLVYQFCLFHLSFQFSLF